MKKNKLASLILASVFLMQTITPSVVKADDFVSDDYKIIEEKNQDNLEEPKVIEEEKQEVEDNVEKEKPVE